TEVFRNTVELYHFNDANANANANSFTASVFWGKNGNDSVAGFGGNGAGWQANSSNISNTAISNDVLTLTGGNFSEARSAYYTTAVPTTGDFVAGFTYTANSNGFPSNAADGVTFVLQTAGTGALGGAGGGLGYYGLAGPSLAVAFNIYQPNGV